MATSAKDFLKANPNYIGYANTASRSKAAPSKKGSGSKSWLSSIISELGGAGGATAGAAAGAALGAPIGGIGAIPGGIIGGLVGGFAGGFGGRAVENQVRDKELRLGDAFKEGAVSGAFGAGGAAFQGARGAYAAGKAAGAGGGGLINTMKAGSGVIDDAILAAEKVGGKSAARQFGKTLIGSGAKTGKAVGQGATSVDDISYASQRGLQSLGNKGRASQRGISAGVRDMTPAQADSYNRTINNVSKWGSGIGKDAQYRNLDDAMKEAVSVYAKSPEGAKAFGKQNADDVAIKFLEGIDGNPTLRAQVEKGINKTKVQNIYDDIAKLSGKSNKEFVDYVKNVVNPRYKAAVAGGNAGSVEAQIYEQLRQASKSVIDENLLARSTFNKQFAPLKGATEQLGKTITRDSGQATDMTLGKILSNVYGPAADVAGRGAQQVGKVTKYTTPTIRGAITRGLVNGGGEAQPVDPSMEQPMSEQIVEGGTLSPEALYGSTAMNQSPMMDMGMQQPQPVQSAYTLEQAIADMQANPDAKSRKNIMDYYNFVSGAEAARNKASGTTLSAQEKKSQKQAQTALMGLQQLKSLYSNAGGGQNRLPGLFGTVQGKLGANSQADAYNKIRDSLTTALARAFGETGVLTDQDREVYKQALPRLEDTPEEAQIKLQYLEDMLAESSQSYGETDYGTQADLSSILSQYGGM